MGKIKYFFDQLRFVKPRDYLACFQFAAALPVSWFYKLKRKNLWLVCERSNEARDNGYWFYKYMREQHPEQDCVYAIQKKSPDYEKVSRIPGEVIEFGSFKHWLYYLVADINISSQKEGKPNAAVCHFLEVYGIRKNRRVYLKHGIVHNDLKWHYYDVTKMWLYICSADREKAFCEEKFGYPKGSIVLTGLCRFDNLNDDILDSKTIFVMPTSREWLARPVKDYESFDDIYHFENTEYFKAWSAFLTDERVDRYIEQNDLKFVFFLHPNMQKYSDSFRKLNLKAEILTSADVDLQEMMKRAACMITDYTSAVFDFAYMKKPVLYYQFDYAKFREGHYQEGYFDYHLDGFGDVCSDCNSLVNSFCSIIDHNMEMPDCYRKRVEAFFKFHDSKNCERVYSEILKRRNAES